MKTCFQLLDKLRLFPKKMESEEREEVATTIEKAFQS
jgi:hypothetical protein